MKLTVERRHVWMILALIGLALVPSLKGVIDPRIAYGVGGALALIVGSVTSFASVLSWRDRKRPEPGEAPDKTRHLVGMSFMALAFDLWAVMCIAEASSPGLTKDQIALWLAPWALMIGTAYCLRDVNDEPDD